MIKLIRLDKIPGLFTLRGPAVPKGKLLVGSLEDAHAYLKDLGVDESELKIAQEYLIQQPTHNAVDFGINLSAVVSSIENVEDVYAKLGVEEAV